MPARRSKQLIAYDVIDKPDMPLEPAPTAREWMDRSGNRYAYRCLPLVIANQSGWVLRCPYSCSARWNGSSDLAAVKIRQPKKVPRDCLLSHFGEGIVTFSLPFLFRTPPGINLWVKGPSNWIKDGIQPLEGVVETDWAETTFTMNWKLTRRNHTVRFEEGEPICMIVPIPRGLAESLDPVYRPLHADPKLSNSYDKWRESRLNFNTNLNEATSAAAKQGWQRDYMLGQDIDGNVFAEHQTKLALRKFRKTTSRDHS